jgi:hypothetical protein
VTPVQSRVRGEDRRGRVDGRPVTAHCYNRELDWRDTSSALGLYETLGRGVTEIRGPI